MDTRDSNQMSQSPSLCRSGCGFYGNPSSDGLCSKCYKDAVKRKQSAPSPSPSSASSVSHTSTARTSSPIPYEKLNTASPTVPSAHIAQELINIKSVEGSENQESSQSNVVNTPNAATDSTTGSTETTSQIETSQSDPPKTSKKKKNRCTKCKVNVGVIGFPCRCGGTFCASHRYANEHSCTFDYREHGAEEIRKNNPQVIGEKVSKI